MISSVYRKLSISGKLSATFALICIICVLSSSILIYKTAADRIDATTVNFAKAINSQVVSNVENFMTSYQGLMLSVLVDSDVFAEVINESTHVTTRVENQTYINKLLFRLVKMQPNIIYAGILLNNGENFQTGITGEKADVQALMNKNWMKEGIEADSSFFLVPMHEGEYINRYNRDAVISVVQRLRSGSKKKIGVIVLDVDPEAVVYLGTDFLSEDGVQDVRVVIENTFHQVIYDSALSDDLQYKEDGFISYDSPGSEYEIITDELEKYGVLVHTIYPKSNLILGRQVLIGVTVLVVLLCIIFASFFAIRFSKFFTKPILDLEQAFGEMQKEHYTSIEGYAADDELGQLIEHYNQMVGRMQYLIDEIYRVDIQKKDAQLVALQAQINPHMLFNTLESIRMKALLSGNKDVATMTRLLGKMFRTVLENVNENHSVKDELDYVQSFLTLQNLRLKTENTLDINVNEELQSLPCMPILFQPLVENSIEHGRREGQVPMHIQIHGDYTEEGSIVFQIIDDGIGMEPDRLMTMSDLLEQIRDGSVTMESFTEEGRKHIGLENIAKRLGLQYNGRAWLRIAYSNESGTCMEIVIQ